MATSGTDLAVLVGVRFEHVPTLDVEEEIAEPDWPPPIAPGRRTRSERLPVQRKAVAGAPAVARRATWSVGGDDPFAFHLGPRERAPRSPAASAVADVPEVHEVAARGVAGPGAPLPFLDVIQRSFGRHALGDVRAHHDQAAGAAAAALGARAYATGGDVAFAGAVDLHTAAHEAAHVVQQRAGVQLAGGLGAADDVYERHADLVADLVVRGASAEAALDRSPAGGHGRAVQREIEHEVRPPREVAGIHDYVVALNGAVQKAYMYLLHVPDLGPYKDLDGYTQQWVESWELHTKGTPHPMMAAHFGYAVESLTTLVYLPAAPGGMAIELQGPRGATRPDVILKRGAEDLAWMDITAEDSRGHIWKKDGWDRQDFHLAEVSYPKMQPHLFQPTPGYKDDVDPQAFAKRKFFADYVMRVRREAWVTLGLGFKAPRGGDPLIRESTLPPRILARLSQHFGVPLDRPTAASVLTVMGVNPTTHCLHDSISQARGVAFLLQHDPNLPTIEIPEDGGVPRLLIPSDYAAKLEMLRELEARRELDFDLQEPASDERSDPSEQALVPHGEEDQGAQDLALLPPEQTFELRLPSLHIPAPILGQLEQFLAANDLSFVLSLDNGVTQGQFFLQPGQGFVANLQQALGELERGGRADGGRQLRGRVARRQAQWRALMGFVPRRQRGLRRPRDRDAIEAPRPPQPQGMPFPFVPPPFLLTLAAPPEGTQDEERDTMQ